MALEKVVYSIREVLVDERNCTLNYGGKQIEAPPRCLSMLRTLNERPGKMFTESALRNKIPRRRGDGASIRSIASLLKAAIGNLSIPKSVLWIDGTTSKGYSLILPSAQLDLNESLYAPAPPTNVHTPKGEFSFLMDGMILDAVGELLMHDESMVPTMNACRGSYQRSLEDFAFSVVYASSIISALDINRLANDPARVARVEIASHLGRIWRSHNLDQDLKKGKILETASYRELVRADVKAAGQCLLNTGWPFRDWLFCDVPRHLGDHESLFEANLPSAEFVFKDDPTLSHYREPDLQAAFGEEATRLAIAFLGDAVRRTKRKYSASALREFATASVVALVTVMHENDMSAERSHIWRMPHLIRSLVKQHVLFDCGVKQQILLKSIVTQHALAAALRQIQNIDRRSLITVLMNMRDAFPFESIRHMLEEHRLLLSQPKKEDDQKARLVLNEIARLADSDKVVSERFTLAQGAALRALSKTHSDQYETRLHRVFPALKPSDGRRR